MGDKKSSFAMSTTMRFHLLLALSRFHTAFVKGMPLAHIMDACLNVSTLVRQ
jgi:hypothetical protein